MSRKPKPIVFEIKKGEIQTGSIMRSRKVRRRMMDHAKLEVSLGEKRTRTFVFSLWPPGFMIEGMQEEYRIMLSEGKVTLESLKLKSKVEDNLLTVTFPTGFNGTVVITEE